MVRSGCPVCAWRDLIGGQSVQCVRAARIADHIVPVSWGGQWYPENGQGLCQTHHNHKTTIEQAIAIEVGDLAGRVARLYAALPWLARSALTVPPLG